MAKQSQIVNNNDEILVLEEYISLNPVIDSPDSIWGIEMRHGHSFRKIDKQGYKHFIEGLYAKHKGTTYLISLKEFENLILKIFFEIKESPDTPHDIKNEIEKYPVVEGHVLLPIYNVDLSVDTLQIGQFTLVKYQYIDTYLKSKEYVIPETLANSLQQDTYFQNVPFVDIPVQMRDNRYGFEIGRKILSSFINFINYTLYSDIKGIETVSDRTYAGNRDRHFVVSEAGFSESFSTTPIGVKHLNLNDVVGVITDNENGNNALLTIVGKNAPENEIETRLINAVNWIGMAIAEKNNAIAFTQAIFAIECMLQFQQSGEPISKSIVASIGEEVAFLLGTTVENRKELEKRFKSLYGIRSKIAHGKSADISVDQVLDAISLAKQIVCSILTTPAFKKAKTMQMINNHIEKMRYTYDVQEDS